ncbi:formyltransferase family protein [Helicobacter muridarum]|uniref:formyltransferase family protein n=1 Tax=Helicobacter muridarum TaxID=216 RepID=UPI000CF0681A|nr:formyltransferase family protein [Helicobacter muridarum]
MIFDQIIIIGSGSIASDILDSMCEFTSKLESNIKPTHISSLSLILESSLQCISLSNSMQLQPILAMSYCSHSLSLLQHKAKKHNIPYLSCNDSNTLDIFFASIDFPTLVISANNNYIFKSSAICNENLKIINFHNALLPCHKGVNAPIWSIYEQDEKSGVTWHVVSSKLDSGDILIQKEMPIAPDINSLKLFQSLMKLGFDAFVEIKDSLLDWSVSFVPMAKDSRAPHRARDLPNSGFLNPAWDRDKISAFLRSMDAFGVIPKPCIIIHDKVFTITKYWLNISYFQNEISYQRHSESDLLQRDSTKVKPPSNIANDIIGDIVKEDPKDRISKDKIPEDRIFLHIKDIALELCLASNNVSSSSIDLESNNKSLKTYKAYTSSIHDNATGGGGETSLCKNCLLYPSLSPRDLGESSMGSSP